MEAKSNNHKITLIDVLKIVPSPVNQRTNFGDLKGFSLNIKSQGLLSPIVLRINPKDKTGFELVAGERRLRAMKLLKWEMIPSIVRILTDQEAHDITASENLEREDLSPIEEARSVQILLDGDRSPQEVSDRLGKNVKWVKRRAKLADLVPVWIKEFQDIKSPISRWSALHLEFIARYPAERQISILDEMNRTHCWDFATISVKDLGKYLGENELVLQNALWDLKDESIVPGAGACIQCIHRSSQLPDLFDEVITKKGIIKDICLQSVCWNKKLLARHTYNIERHKEKNADLLILNASYSNENIFEDHPLKESIKHDSDFMDCRKKDKGSIQAYVIDGQGAGRTKYVKEYGYHSSSSSNTVGGKKTMKERKQALLKRRVIRYTTKVLQLLEGHEPIHLKPKGEIQPEEKPMSDTWVVPGQRLTNLELFSLIAGYGSASNYTGDNYNKADFELIEDARELGEEKAFDIITQRVFSKIRAELRGQTNVIDPKKIYPDTVCKLLYLDGERLWKMVLEEIKEPKIWATLNADGSKKVITKTKKGGTSKK